ncbi:MAG: acyl-CoA dehydrogenase family protein [Desulfatiglandales bacterium]
MAEAAIEYALQYATKRVTFGQPLIRHQAISFMIADAWTLDRGRKGAYVKGGKAMGPRYQEYKICIDGQMLL